MYIYIYKYMCIYIYNSISYRDSEVGRVEQLAPLEPVGRVRAPDGGLSKVALGNLVGH